MDIDNINPPGLQVSKTLSLTSKQDHARSQHTPKSWGRLISPKSSYHHAIITDAPRKGTTAKGCEPHIWDTASTSPARTLLCQARQYIELDVNRYGRRPAVMDIILELLAPGEHDDDTLIKDIERSQRLNQPHCEYGPVCKDQDSLHGYWAHQSHVTVDVPRAKFDISAERSTVGWIDTLEGDASDNDSSR